MRTRIIAQYNIYWDTHTVRIDVWGETEHLKIHWQPILGSVSKTAIYLNKTHDWYGTEKDDLIWELATLAEKLDRWLGDDRKEINRKFREEFKRHPEGYLELLPETWLK